MIDKIREFYIVPNRRGGRMISKPRIALTVFGVLLVAGLLTKLFGG